jgi:hypothetical protein
MICGVPDDGDATPGGDVVVPVVFDPVDRLLLELFSWFG